MHEFSLISAVIDTLEDFSAQQSLGPIKKISLRVGQMRQVIPATMQFAFKTAREGTALAGAELELIESPIVIRCPKCGREWGGEHMGLINTYLRLLHASKGKIRMTLHNENGAVISLTLPIEQEKRHV